MIVREEKDSVVVLRLAHGKASALDLELLEALNMEIDRAETAEASAVIITGTGHIFSAGVDLFRLVEGNRAEIGHFLALLNRTLEQLFRLPVPTVAAVNGHAIAGGCILALACDYRLMANDGGKMGVTELLVGVPFPPAALEILRFGMNRAYVQRVIYTGETYSASTAREMGMIDEVVAPDMLMDRALAVAQQFARVPAETFRQTKRELRRPTVERFEKTASDSGGEIARVWSSPETLAGIHSYLDRTVRKGR